LRLKYVMCGYLSLVHALAVWAVLASLAGAGRDQVKTPTLVFAFLLAPISGLGVTAGAHRLWAHRSYQAHWALRLFLMLCNSLANQFTIFQWALDHRTHHLHSDTEADPHDSNRGFVYSHMGWLLVHRPEAVGLARRKVDMSDLKKDPVVMLQHLADPWWNLLWCFVAPAIFAAHAFGETAWNGFLYAGVLRYVFTLHCTFSVNSIVHQYGPSPYDPTQPPAESGLVSLLTSGEGWHSWHHAFPFDYAAAELGALSQYNPTKVFIDLCALVGLVSDRKRGHRMWGQRLQRMVAAASERHGGKPMRVSQWLEGPPMFRTRRLEIVEQDDGVSPTGRVRHGEGAES